jgi:hypothetical protein
LHCHTVLERFHIRNAGDRLAHEGHQLPIDLSQKLFDLGIIRRIRSDFVERGMIEEPDGDVLEMELLVCAR